MCAVVSKTAAYVAGPSLLRRQSGDHDNRHDTEQGQQPCQEHSFNDNENANSSSDEHRLNERAPLLRQGTRALPHRIAESFKRRWRNISCRFTYHVRQDLALFETPYADVAIAAALCGAVLGLVPSLHRAFFYPAEKGGTVNAWLTTSIQNIGKLFTTFQIFVVGCTLAVSFERMRASADSGKIPIRALLFVFCVRLVLWPV